MRPKYATAARGSATALGGVHSPPSANPIQCAQGALTVNVNYTLINDFDSGVHGNAWANDTINRHLQIRQVGNALPTLSTQYCAMINDTGSFVAFKGMSPAGTGTVSAGITGRIDGGYTTLSFTSTLNPGPAYATHGNLGTFNLNCDMSFNCPGTHPSFLSYFSGSPSWDYADWGWAYHTAQHGNWINADSGNSGDITG